jgi:hypothetical protein
MAAAGGLFAARSARELATQWLGWLDDDGARIDAGLAARRRLTAGAAALSARRIAELMGG